jgi:hypothetical protein
MSHPSLRSPSCTLEKPNFSSISSFSTTLSNLSVSCVPSSSRRGAAVESPDRAPPRPRPRPPPRKELLPRYPGRKEPRARPREDASPNVPRPLAMVVFENPSHVARMSQSRETSRRLTDITIWSTGVTPYGKQFAYAPMKMCLWYPISYIPQSLSENLKNLLFAQGPCTWTWTHSFR